MHAVIYQDSLNRNPSSQTIVRLTSRWDTVTLTAFVSFWQSANDDV